MVSRIVLAAIVALFIIGSCAAPVSAKGAFGGGGHPGFAFHSGPQPRVPFVAHGRFFARERVHAIGSHRLALPPDQFSKSKSVWWWGFDATGFDATGPYAYYYPPYEPSGGAAAGELPAPPPPTAGDGAPHAKPVVIYRPGCRTQTQTVPSEFTGTRTINITRCY
jgi:hypothetical protein